MNRLNPLHIIALLSVLLAFALFQLKNAQGELVELQDKLGTTTQLTTELVSLKKVYADKKQLKRKIEKILRYSTIRNAKVSKKYKKSGVRLESESIDLVALNALMGKLLNASFNITTLKVKKLSDKKASLYVEIKW